MKQSGTWESPFWEHPHITGWIRPAWGGEGSGAPPLRQVFGLRIHGNPGHGIWSISESGTETGSATALFTGGIANQWVNSALVSHSGPTIIFGTTLVRFFSVSPGAHWSMAIEAEVPPAPSPFGEEGAYVVTCYTVNADETPGEVVLEVVVQVSPIPFPGGLSSGSASGVAPG